jgi:ABC-2 type transport system permease protein
VQMYRGVVRTLLTFVIPVALLTTVPAEAILGRGSLDAVVVSVAVAAALLLISSRLWLWSLRHYTGASA